MYIQPYAVIIVRCTERHSVTLRTGWQSLAEMGCMHVATSARLGVMAIALDGSFPDSSPDGVAGQTGLRRFASRPARNAMPTPGLTQGYLGFNAFSDDNQPSGQPAGAGSQSPRRPVPPHAATAADLEPRLVKESFARLMSESSAAMEYFYARLFTANPDSRALFPTSMTMQRERHIRRPRAAGLEPGQSAGMRRATRPAWPRASALRRDRTALQGILRGAARHRRAFHRRRLDSRDRSGLAGGARLHLGHHAGGRRRGREDIAGLVDGRDRRRTSCAPPASR